MPPFTREIQEVRSSIFAANSSASIRPSGRRVAPVQAWDWRFRSTWCGRPWIKYLNLMTVVANAKQPGARFDPSDHSAILGYSVPVVSWDEMKNKHKSGQLIGDVPLALIGFMGKQDHGPCSSGFVAAAGRRRARNAVRGSLTTSPAFMARRRPGPWRGSWIWGPGPCTKRTWRTSSQRGWW